MTRRARLIGVTAALLLMACGGDDDDGDGGKVASGLPAQSKLSTLDKDDAELLCMSLSDGFNGLLTDSAKERIACTVLAVPLSIKIGSDGELAGDVPKCKDLVNRCLNGETISSEPPAFEVEDTFIDESKCMASEAAELFEGCEATVGDFEGCADEMLERLSSRFDIISCDSLSNPDALLEMNSEDLEPENIPACKPLFESCPNLDFGPGEDVDEEVSG